MGPGKRLGAADGYTIVEIITVLAIVGILVVIAVSNFRGLNEKYRVEEETKQLFADLMDVRGRAVQRNRTFFVTMTGNGYATYEDVDPAPDGNGDLNTALDNVVTTVSGTHAITSIPNGVTSLKFDRGGIADTTVEFHVASNANADYDCITVRPTRIRLGKVDGGGNCVEK